jgi:hypothetical protein
MSLTHSLEDSAYCDICHELRLIKALGGVLMSAADSGDDMEADEIGSLACQVHESAMKIMQAFKEMEEKNSPVAGAQSPASDLPNLNAYEPEYVTAKVSVAAMNEHLKALDAIADDPAKVKAWGEKLRDELGKCQWDESRKREIAR